MYLRGVKQTDYDHTQNYPDSRFPGRSIVRKGAIRFAILLRHHRHLHIQCSGKWKSCASHVGLLFWRQKLSGIQTPPTFYGERHPIHLSGVPSLEMWRL